MYLYKRQTDNQTWAVLIFCLGPHRESSGHWSRLLGPTLNTSFPSLKCVGFLGRERERRVQSCASVVVTHIKCSIKVSGGRLFSSRFRFRFYRGCAAPGMGLDRGFRAGCPPGPRPWMSTLGTRGLWRPGCAVVGVRYMLLNIAAAADVVSTVPSRLGW